MRHIIIAALVALAAPAAATTVATWSGPGIHACIDRCSEAWAVSQLTPAQRQELADVQSRNPTPLYLPIEDGDYMPLMAYFKDGSPRMDRRGTVAVLDAPSSAWGWQMRGWRLVHIEACGNWAVVLDNRKAVVLDRLAAPIARTQGRAAWTPISAPLVPHQTYPGHVPPYLPPVIVVPPYAPPVTPPVIPAVPLPASGFLMLLALGALVGRAKFNT